MKKQLFLTVAIVVTLHHISFAQTTKSTTPKDKNLILNGDFESGDKSPTGWQPVDGLATFYINDPLGKRGRIIMMDTDIYADQARAWWKSMIGGASAAGAPRKRPTSGNKYDTVAGLDGVHFYSEFFPIKPGVPYILSCDFRGKWEDGAVAFVPKLWLRAYKEKIPNDKFGIKDMGDENAAVRKGAATGGPYSSGGANEVGQSKSGKTVPKPYDYQGDLVCRGENQNNDWSHVTRTKPITIPDRAQYKDLKWARVCIFTYWPPGVYYFDNVKLIEVGKE